MTSGSVMSAMTRSVPPQNGHVVMSMSNTRRRRSAQVSGAVGSTSGAVAAAVASLASRRPTHLTHNVSQSVIWLDPARHAYGRYRIAINLRLAFPESESDIPIHHSEGQESIAESPADRRCVRDYSYRRTAMIGPRTVRAREVAVGRSIRALRR